MGMHAREKIQAAIIEKSSLHFLLACCSRNDGRRRGAISRGQEGRNRDRNNRVAAAGDRCDQFQFRSEDEVEDFALRRNLWVDHVLDRGYAPVIPD